VDTTESSDGETLVFKVKGGNAAVLIGKKGQTLDAIQYLVEKIVNRHSENRLRLQVDVEGYLENRKTNLENLAFRLAQKAKKIGKPMTIGQLKPQERRVVHLALKANPDVRTQSVGDGFVRKLVIIPRKKQETS
jgi:spoIIIJ-associated protein